VSKRNCLPEQEPLTQRNHLGAKANPENLQNGNFRNMTRYVAQRTDESFSHE
jgi:hypothetical protein